MRYPGIYRAALLIALDNGGINRCRSEKQHRADFDRWIERQPPGPLVPEIDAWLAALSDADLEAVCCCGEGEPERDRAMEGAPPFVDDMLNRYFEEVC